jgi:hypothetical protein
MNILKQFPIRVSPCPKEALYLRIHYNELPNTELLYAAPSPILLYSGNSWVFQSGRATTTVDGMDFGHYFYVENVKRNSGGDIATSGNEDPSTQKVTIYIAWPGETEFNVSEYIMRTGSAFFVDRGWVDANLGDGPYTSSVGTYSTSSGAINITGGALGVE